MIGPGSLYKLQRIGAESIPTVPADSPITRERGIPDSAVNLYTG